MTPDTTPRTAPRSQLDWLRAEVPHWQAEGLIDADQGTALLHRYRAAPDPDRRFSLARLMLTLGALFVGVGLIWLVGANLDQLPPLTRFAVVATIWLALLVGAEMLDARVRSHSPLLVGTARLLGALAFGAVVFQAAQSLQVPAYEAVLVGVWGAGALVHGYAVRGTGPLLVGLGAGTGWFLWRTLEASPTLLGGVLGVAAGAVLAVSLAAVHERRGDGFGPPWRAVGALLALSALFMAAIPYSDSSDLEWNAWLVGGLVVAGLAAAGALVTARGTARWEPLGALAAFAISVALVVWDTGSGSLDSASGAADPLTLADWAHAAVSVGAYAGLAVGIAALGIIRSSWPLTALATAGLVVFTTFQSFAVFAQIIQGAWLFVVLGLIFLGTGYAFDRARRGLAATLEGVNR